MVPYGGCAHFCEAHCSDSMIALRYTISSRSHSPPDDLRIQPGVQITKSVSVLSVAFPLP
jgi:hypothetical protein